MNTVWKKRLQTAGWLTLTAGGLVLLVAAVQRKDSKVCKDIKVELSGSANNFFIDEKEVLSLLNANGRLIETKISDINLQLMERRLEKDTWIANAELFFDKNEILQAKIEEREPVARVFTSAGSSFYIDSACRRLPLSDKVSVRVPMFTSFPSQAKRLYAKDSALLTSIKELATFIRGDQFWNAQVAQIDITPERTFEMIPTIGNQVIALGLPGDYANKFNRLLSFYKEVWTKVGLEKYSKIDVQYNGQVVATKRGAWSASVDSVRAKEAFEKLMKENEEMQSAEVNVNANAESKPAIALNDDNVISRSMDVNDAQSADTTAKKKEPLKQEENSLNKKAAQKKQAPANPGAAEKKVIVMKQHETRPTSNDKAKPKALMAKPTHK